MIDTLCDCGHDADDHQNAGGSCRGYRMLADDGMPVDHCTCRNYKSAIEAEREELIIALRQQVVNDLSEAISHLRCAQNTIAQLMSNHIYDVEWAEGGDSSSAVNLLNTALDKTVAVKAIATSIANLGGTK